MSIESIIFAAENDPEFREKWKFIYALEEFLNEAGKIEEDSKIKLEGN